MKIYVTSDTHFGHRNIIKYCNRPFNSVEQMDSCMIDIWNAIIKPNDIVFHLGDFSLAGAEIAGPIIDKLNGKKILIAGNHDRGSIKNYPAWKRVSNTFDFHYKGIEVHMRHEPWDEIEHEEHLYLHGHCHGNMGVIHDKQIDAGVDCWDMAPVELEEIIEFWREHANN